MLIDSVCNFVIFPGVLFMSVSGNSMSLCGALCVSLCMCVFSYDHLLFSVKVGFLRGNFVSLCYFVASFSVFFANFAIFTL